MSLHTEKSIRTFLWKNTFIRFFNTIYCKKNTALTNTILTGLPSYINKKLHSTEFNWITDSCSGGACIFWPPMRSKLVKHLFLPLDMGGRPWVWGALDEINKTKNYFSEITFLGFTEVIPAQLSACWKKKWTVKPRTYSSVYS